MPTTRTRRGTAGRAAPAPAPAGASTGVAAMMALQRSAGNTSTVALMRRAHEVREESPITLTMPEVVDRAEVSSYDLEYDGNRKLVGLNITRPTDADSPRLAQAMTNGWPSGVTATFLVRRLTPLGWIRVFTITMDNCMVSSFTAGADHDLVGLSFTRAHLEYEGAET